LDLGLGLDLGIGLDFGVGVGFWGWGWILGLGGWGPIRPETSNDETFGPETSNALTWSCIRYIFGYKYIYCM